jgi:hypothetical protein
MLKLIILLSLGFIPFSALGFDKNGNYEAVGLGNKICSDIIDDIKTNDPAKDDLESWIGGYLTAYNLIVPDTDSISGTSNMDHHIEWMKKYCKVYPKKTLAKAMQALTLNLYLVRYKEAPQGI